jgi:hypothetical protein
MKTCVHFFFIILRSILFRIEKFQSKFLKKIKTHYILLYNLFRKSVVYEIMWKSLKGHR